MCNVFNGVQGCIFFSLKNGYKPKQKEGKRGKSGRKRRTKEKKKEKDVFWLTQEYKQNLFGKKIIFFPIFMKNSSRNA